MTNENKTVPNEQGKIAGIDDVLAIISLITAIVGVVKFVAEAIGAIQGYFASDSADPSKAASVFSVPSTVELTEGDIKILSLENAEGLVKTKANSDPTIAAWDDMTLSIKALKKGKTIIKIGDDKKVAEMTVNVKAKGTQPPTPPTTPSTPPSHGETPKPNKTNMLMIIGGLALLAFILFKKVA